MSSTWEEDDFEEARATLVRAMEAKNTGLTVGEFEKQEVERAKTKAKGERQDYVIIEGEAERV